MLYHNQAHLRSVFYTLREMRTNLLFCDVNLIAGNVEIPANKSILAASSPYFLTMFSNFKEGNEKDVPIVGINPETLTLLIDYVYTGEVEITLENAQDLLFASHLLQFAEVHRFCTEHLEKKLNPTNCLEIEAYADSLDFQHLVNPVKSFICANFEDVIKSEEFLMSTYRQFSSIISMDEVKVQTEKTVFEAILTWIKHDFKSRQQHLASLMKNVRICFLPAQYIINTFVNEPLLKNDPKCLDFITEALQWIPPQIGPPTFKKRRYFSKVILVVGGYPAVKGIEFYNCNEDRWTIISTPRECIGTATITVDGVVYVIGGYGDDSTMMYDIVTETWTTRDFMITYQRYCLGVAMLKDEMYAVGGNFNSRCLDDVHVSMPGGGWRAVASMLTKRTRHGVAVIDDILYAVGGNNTVFLNSVECYDLTNRSWRYVKSMHFKRSGMAVAVLNGLLYAAGGFDGYTYHKSVEVYNPKTDTWTMITDMSDGRSYAAAVALDNRLYVIGGAKGEKENIYDNMEVYNPDTDSWYIHPTPMLGEHTILSATVIEKYC